MVRIFEAIKIVAKMTKIQLKKLSNSVVKEVEHIPNPHEAKREGASWVGSGYTKLYIWSLMEHEKVRVNRFRSFRSFILTQIA